MKLHENLCYLAGPYSDISHTVREERVATFRKAYSLLVRNGYKVACPLLAGHYVVMTDPGQKLPQSCRNPELLESTFLKNSIAVAKACEWCLVLAMPGWRESTGLQRETKVMFERDHPVLFVDPARLLKHQLLSDELLIRLDEEQEQANTEVTIKKDRLASVIALLKTAIDSIEEVQDAE